MTEDILKAIEQFVEEHGYAPTVRDIARMVGASSTSHVHYYLRRLRESGRVDWVDGKSRTLHLVKGGSNAKAPERD